ncbi:MAG: dTDP-4-dehydrorhamnose reductase [Bacteroidales bacterium]|nr:dTDP-4-dehydrorhamnose reductase [Bacteroidales bacterium]
MTDAIKILVTGANGQLGKSFKKTEEGLMPHSCKYIDMADLNLTRTGDVRHYFDHHQFDFVINCAAYTRVDDAEHDQAETFAVNAEVPALLGELSRKRFFKLIHISTDYVFSGNSSIPYKETSKAFPLSIYGKSKHEGEMALRNNENALVIRSAWLYSEFGSNFLTTMLTLGREKKEVSVVCDQIGSPTYATDLAKAIFNIIKTSVQNKFIPGIFHYTNEGICSWFDFAWEIINMSGLPCKVIPIATSQYLLPARRPAYSVLDKSRIKKVYGLEIPYWKESLRCVLNVLATT